MKEYPIKERKSTAACWFCNKEGHQKKECRKYKRWLEQKEKERKSGKQGPWKDWNTKICGDVRLLDRSEKKDWNTKKDWKNNRGIRSMEEGSERENENSFLGQRQSLI